MLRSQPDRATIFAWLRVVAIHEAYRLSRIHRTPHLEDLDHSEGWDAVVAGRVTIDDTIEARRALRAPGRAAADDSAATSRSASPASPTARSPRSPAGARTRTSTSTCARPAPGSASKSCEKRGPKRAAEPLHE